ncbi:hypothetical protein CspHIS471_0301300 [Cutaneotrichosporon sp. HIS471]|nr:hypothetical protein CspHIS471_0301300 [Cutaneotrichosporon sp. HIS471]
MAAAVQSSTNLFRRLAWSATVPLNIRLATAGGPVDQYFIQAPRYTYLALLLPTIREHLVELALDDEALSRTNESDWWFELDVSDSPFPSDALAVPPTVEAVKTHFVSQVKEADFVRWGNTKRVTGLRRADLEAGWDGVVAGDYDLHHRMAGRIVPLPIPASRPTSPQPDKIDSAYSARILPIKVYLPDGAVAIQAPVAPLTDGRPTTLLQMLRTTLPLLFENGYGAAQPIAQGILLPPDADVAWLAACMAGADGWLRIGIRLVAE